MDYQLTSLLMGLALAGVIFALVRRGYLHGPRAFWWISLACGIMILGLWPRLTDLISRYLGVSYPPILAVIAGFGLLFLKVLSLDLERSRQEQRIRRLAQRVAILEARVTPPDSSDQDGTDQAAKPRRG